MGGDGRGLDPILAGEFPAMKFALIGELGKEGRPFRKAGKPGRYPVAGVWELWKFHLYVPSTV